MIDEHDIREMLHRRANAVPASALDAPKATRRARRRLVANGAVAMLAAAAIGVASFAGIDSIRSAPIPATPPETPVPTPPETPVPTPPETPVPTPSIWSPVREGVAMPVERVRTDPMDAALDWVDVTRVDFNKDVYPSDGAWSIKLAGKPPLPVERGPGLLIAYGLVLDTTGDGVADHLIGINNDAPKPGDFRVWVTDLATGETDEQVGPPYGFPIEFGHPDEDRGPPVGGQERRTRASMGFMFLSGTSPDDFDPDTVRYYAWASATRNGEVIAWDYAPDAGWLTKP
jgi:hypothetical protein